MVVLDPFSYENVLIDLGKSSFSSKDIPTTCGPLSTFWIYLGVPKCRKRAEKTNHMSLINTMVYMAHQKQNSIHILICILQFFSFIFGPRGKFAWEENIFSQYLNIYP
jgi:hypothetical protein